MVVYANGMVPLEKMVRLGPEHYLLPGVAAHWNGMVAEGQKLYGVTLRITGGWNGYRPRFAQEIYLRDNYTSHVLPVAGWEYFYAGRWWKRRPGKPKAAKPGTSPHGAYGAVDVANWRDLAGSEREAWRRFSALCAKWRFAVGRVAGEPWHIEFLNDPWFVPAWAGGGGAVVVPPVVKRKARRKMTAGVIVTKGDVDKDRRAAVVDTESGYWAEFSWLSIGDADALAKGYDLERAGVCTNGMFDAQKAEARATAARLARPTG